MNPSSDKQPLRVLHCVLSLDVGGLERIVVDLVRIGTRQGNQVSVLCLERPGVLEGEAKAHGATVSCLHKPPGIVPETVRQAEEFLAREKPDIIHTHQIGALWYVGRAARKVGIPVVHTEHIDNTSKMKGTWKKFKYRVLWHRASKYAERFFCVSADIARSAARWRTVSPKKIEVILNGVDTEMFAERGEAGTLRRELQIPENVRVIGNVGRLNEVKRQDLLLRGFARLRKEVPDTHLLLVGDGPERQRLETLCQELGLGGSVTFAGYQARPERFLQIMDVFALTSRLEGLPLVLLEAWAAKLPIVSTRVGGVPDLVKDGENGLLIADGDEDGLVAALKRLLTDGDEAAAFAQRGRTLVQANYSLTRMAADYGSRYAEVLRERAGREGGSPNSRRV